MQRGCHTGDEDNYFIKWEFLFCVFKSIHVVVPLCEKISEGCQGKLHIDKQCYKVIIKKKLRAIGHTQLLIENHFFFLPRASTGNILALHINSQRPASLLSRTVQPALSLCPVKDWCSTSWAHFGLQPVIKRGCSASSLELNLLFRQELTRVF